MFSQHTHNTIISGPGLVIASFEYEKKEEVLFN